MEINNIICGTSESNFLKEDFINKLNIVNWSYEQYTINNTTEKYYQ